MTTQNSVNLNLSGQTGTTTFVGANGPTLVAPVLGTPASGVLSNCTGYVPSNLSSTTGSGAAVLQNAPSITGTLTASQMIIDSIAFTPTTHGLVGSTAGDSASPGFVGEYISSFVESAAPITLSTNTVADVTSISLTAGDWDVDGNVGFVFGAGTTISAWDGWISSTSATFPISSVTSSANATAFAPSSTVSLIAPKRRFSLAAPTTIYLSAVMSFGVSSAFAYGFISARRVR